MLLQFNVTNYMSYKNEVILSLLAGKDKEHEDILFEYGKDRILPTVSIYGSNASGKTNIFKALNFAIMFVRNSNFYQIDNLINVVPFLLDYESKLKKSRFDFIYIFEGVKYEYGFVVDSKNVYEEYLYEYRSQRPSMIFERENVSEYKFSTATRKELSAIVDKNTNNKLFLSTATTWNALSTRKAYMWFSSYIDTYDSESLENGFVSTLEMNNDSEMKTFMKSMLRNADINISDYDFEIRNGKLESLPLPDGVRFDESVIEQLKQNLKEWKLETHHKVLIDNEERDFVFPLLNESKGTINFLYMGPIIKKTLQLGKTMVIDEIDSGLHPSLVRYLIELFHDKKTNPNGAQLVFNTHDVTQLDLGVFRRDQIYFAEKDNSTGISDLYSLDEYAPRKTENIQKGYLQGRYGAIPTIGFEGIEW